MPKNIPLHYLHKHHELINQGGPKPEISSKAKFQLWMKFRGELQKYLDLLQFPPFVIRILFAPKNSPILFNHTKRIRKGAAGNYSVYASRLIEEIPSLLIVEEFNTPVIYPRTARVIRSSWIPRVAGILRRLDFKNPKEITVFHIKKFIWKLVFRWLKPSKVLLVVWYGKEWAVAAAKDLNIPVIELQHGVVYDIHPFYLILEDQKIPGSNYLLPDQAWVYGKYWAEKHVKMGWEPERVAVCGMYLDVKLKNPDKIPKKPYILYSSQPGFHFAMISHINSIRSELKSRDISAIIAPHPAESHTVFADLLDDSVQVYPELDTYDLVSGCQAHLSYFSTMLIEAILFDKPSYQIDLDTDQKCPWDVADLVEFGVNQKIKLGEFPGLASDRRRTIEKSKVEYFFGEIAIQELLKS